MFCYLRQFALIMLNTLFFQTATKLFFDNTMNLQIRISSDWRSKMAIILASKTKVSGTFHRIFCLLHTPKSKAANHSLLRCSRNFRQKLLDFLAAFAFGAVLLLGEIIGSWAGAAFIIGSIFLIILALLLIFWKRLFVNIFVKLFIGIFYDNE